MIVVVGWVRAARMFDWSASRHSARNPTSCGAGGVGLRADFLSAPDCEHADRANPTYAADEVIE